MDAVEDKIEIAGQLQGSFILFCQYFYKALNKREFIISQPPGRESHFITCARALSSAARGEIGRLILNLPPGHGKSTLLTMWVAWTMSMYPDSNYMYISYSKKIATKQTEIIKRLMSLKEYQFLFNVKIMHDSKAKDYFKTLEGGVVAAFGSEGSITGFDAGLPALDRFSGALIIDDSHKPDEVHSDTIREGVIQSYMQTASQRVRGHRVPIIFLGQRLHEADLPAFLLEGGTGDDWERIVLTSLDENDNPLYPESFPYEMLCKVRDFNPYVWASQHMQNPIPAGGALFKPEYFHVLDEEPEMLTTFIVCDTAETDKTYNDATVFSFFGLYEIKNQGADMKTLGLHWIDCMEIRVEPKDLQPNWIQFWTNCCRYKTAPSVAYIEKKSSGSTLLSLLKEIRGIRILDIQREAKKSKTQRFLDSQPVVYEGRISIRDDESLVKLVTTHMSKITANNSHRFDDIADTLADGVKIALIDKLLYNQKDTKKTDDFLIGLRGHHSYIENAMRQSR
jgi:predicted phage terminase large subunit-like protein